MSTYEHLGRSPMASRRVRRHAMGVSNSHCVDDSVSSISRSSVSLIHADRIIKVPQHLRPLDPAARETRVEDRPLVTRVHDKLFKTHRERYVRKVLRSCAGDGSNGFITREQMRTALDRLHVGLEREEKERIIARVAPEESSKVHYLEFLREFEIPQPLGDEVVAVARGTSVPGPPIVRPGGGGSGVGDGGKSYWNWHRHPKTRLPGLLDQVREGTFEQHRSDALLTGLLASKIGNCRDKLRAVFRQMDKDRNSLIGREEFANGIAKLNVDVSREQIDHLFELCDTDRNGFIDYTEFSERFGEPGLHPNTRVNMTAAALDRPSATTAGSCGTSGGGGGGVPLTQAMALSPDEVQGGLRHPLVQELARSLYGKGNQASAPFKQLDLPRSGRLDVQDMTAACRTLVPGIGERQVAAVMALVDPEASSHVDYRAFITRVEGGLSHPRMAHSAPPGSKTKTDSTASTGALGSGASAGTLGALARFGEPLTVPAPLPTPHTRALSAVSLSHRPDTDADVATGSGGPRRVAQPPPPPALGKNAPDRDRLYTLHAVAIKPFLESLDSASNTAGEGSRPFVTRSVVVEQDAGSQAPSHATGRFSRFWSKRYADTSSVTSADPSSSMHALPNGVFMRKGSMDEFLHFQKEDKAREAHRREQLVQRHAARSKADSNYSAQDDASGAGDGRLVVGKATKQRYEERCELYDRVRQIQEKGDHAFFGRLPVFEEHKSDAANMPVRADQTRSYW